MLNAETKIQAAENKQPLQRIITRFRTNSAGFFTQYRWYVILFFVALLIDAYSTVYFMSRWGAYAELHPIVQYFSVHFGVVIGPFLGAWFKALLCVVMAIYFKKYAHYLFFSAAAIYLWAAWYNMWSVSLTDPFFLVFF